MLRLLKKGAIIAALLTCYAMAGALTAQYQDHVFPGGKLLEYGHCAMESAGTAGFLWPVTAPVLLGVHGARMLTGAPTPQGCLTDRGREVADE